MARKSHKKTLEELEDEIEQGEVEADVYSSAGRQGLVDDDEIDGWEEGFMEGEDTDSELSVDALTGEPLSDTDEIIEIKIKGETYRFVSEENAEEFRERLEEEDDFEEFEGE